MKEPLSEYGWSHAAGKGTHSPAMHCLSIGLEASHLTSAHTDRSEQDANYPSGAGVSGVCWGGSCETRCNNSSKVNHPITTITHAPAIALLAIDPKN